MIAMPFDSLQFAKKLKAAKDPEAQAEVVAEAFRVNFGEIREGFDERDKALAAVNAKVQELAADTKNNAEKMATKEDVIRLEGKITNLEQGIANLGQGMNAKMEGLENRLLVKLGKMLAIGVGLIVTTIGISVGIIIKLMPHA